MDAIRILGDVLGNRQLSRGRGGSVLDSIINGAGRGGIRPQRARPRAGAIGRPVNSSPLGGLIRDAVDIYGQIKANKDRREFEKDMRRRAVQDRNYRRHNHGRRPADDISVIRPDIRDNDCRFPRDRVHGNQQAKLLLRAMIYAARSDGRLDQMERQNILNRMGYLSPQERRFLEREFTVPINVRRFARDVPPGLEDEVYAISLTAIDLDTNREVRYLRELARELELNCDEVAYLHGQVGAPPIN